MASYFIYDRISTKGSRIKVENIEGNSTNELKRAVASALSVPETQFELIYGGLWLKNDQSLESYDIRPGVTIHAIKKVMPQEEVIPVEPMDKRYINQLHVALQSAVRHPAYQSTVEGILANPDTLMNLMATTPGLAEDQIATSFIRSPELLAMLVNRDNLTRVIQKHPALGQAALMIATAANEEFARGSVQTAQARQGVYSLDQMSDDDDEEEGADSNSSSPRHSTGRSQRGQGHGVRAGGPQITTSQLAAALAVASGGAGPSSGTSTASGPALASVITTDFFQQAMQQAVGAEVPHSEPQLIESQLQQLRDMGISDEAVARHALEATGGDVQAALELIFGEGNI